MGVLEPKLLITREPNRITEVIGAGDRVMMPAEVLAAQGQQQQQPHHQQQVHKPTKLQE